MRMKFSALMWAPGSFEIAMSERLARLF